MYIDSKNKNNFPLYNYNILLILLLLNYRL